MTEKEIFEKIKAFVGEENWHQYLEALRGGTLREEAVKVYLFNHLLEREGLLNSVVYYHSRNDFQRNVPDYRYEEGHYKVAIEIKPFAEKRAERRRQDMLLEVETSYEAMLRYIPLSSYYERRDIWEQIRNYAEIYEFVILTNMVDAYLFHRHGIEFGTQLQKPEHFGVIPFEEIFQHIKTQTLCSFLKQKLLHYPLKELDKRFFDNVRYYYKHLEESITDVIRDEKERKELIFKLLISLVLARTMEDFLIVPYGIIENTYKNEKNLFERKQEKFVERFLRSIYDLFWTYYDTEFFEIYNENLLKQKNLVETLGMILGYEKWNETFGKGLKFYDFRFLNEDILGGVYEMFLAWLKTDERKKQGIYYTPKVVTEYFADKVEEFLLRPLKKELLFLINEEKWDEAESIVKKFMEIKVIDPACGSGSFLIKVYKKFLESYDEILKELKEKEKVIMQGAQEILKGSKFGRSLSKAREGVRKIESLIMGRSVSDLREINKAELYKKVAERHIFGVDIDSFAVKLAKLNLLVEALKHGGPNVYGYNKLQNRSAEEVFSDLKENLKTFDSVGCSLDEFLEAFGGIRFDAVLGNPPYVRHERIDPNYKESLVRIYGLNQRTLDYSCYFVMRGLEILKESGYLMFIITNKWLRSDYGRIIRNFLKNYNLVEFLDFTSAKVFKKYEYDKERDSFKRQDVGVDVVTMIVQKEKPFQYVKIGVYKEEESSKEQDLETKLRRYLENETNRIILEQEALTNQKFWTLADSEVLKLKEKINKIGKPLKEWDVKIYIGVLTGYNNAFIIDTQTRNRILANCKDEEERKRTEEIIKPVLRGRDIERYRYKWAGLWIILATKHTITSCVLDYLKKHKKALEKRAGNQEWYELQAPPSREKINLLLLDKIGYSDIGFKFAFIQNGIVGLNTTYFIIPYKNRKNRRSILLYLLGLLNSKLIMFYYRNTAQALSKEATRGFSIYVEQIPIPPITPQNQPLADQIVQKVQEILTLTHSPDFETSKEKQQKVKELEKEIDQLVYKLYALTEEEIRLIEQEGEL